MVYTYIIKLFMTSILRELYDQVGFITKSENIVLSKTVKQKAELCRASISVVVSARSIHTKLHTENYYCTSIVIQSSTSP